MSDRLPAAPRGSKAAGRRLWTAIVTDFELAEHELSLLRQAVHVADTCADLQAVVDKDGPMRNGRAHPAVVELRAQRLTLARLVTCLRVPIADETEQGRTQRRGIRGVYSLRGGAA